MRGGAAGATLAAGALLAGCGFGAQGLNLYVDDRVDIVSPGDQDEVSLPVTIEWTVEDFDGSFGVLVDRSPPPPGELLEYLVRNDELCKTTPGCPDEQFLADRDIYRTTGTSITIDRVPDLGERNGRDLHEVTVVLLDDAGERVGESAFRVEFEIPESGSDG